jgi:hypothetical protein
MFQSGLANMKALLTALMICFAGQANAYCLLLEYKCDQTAEILSYMECLIDEQATALADQAKIISLIDDQLYEMRIQVLELENELARAHNRIDELEE